MMHNGHTPYVIKQPTDYQTVSSLDNQHNYQMINYYAPPLPFLSNVSGRPLTQLREVNHRLDSV